MRYLYGMGAVGFIVGVGMMAIGMSMKKRGVV